MAELFRSQVRFYGKHGLYLEALTPDAQDAKDESLSEIARKKYLFKAVVDIYSIAPLVGYLYQRKAPRDGSEQTKNIFEGALSNHYDRLLFSYQLLMILDKASEPDLNERLRRAFQADDDVAKIGSDLFNDYARGGIEVLYENLIEGVDSPETMLMKLVDFVDDFDSHFIKGVEVVDLSSLLF
ncbi:hypothetical protein [Atopobium sp. oral taxon 810]|uniref:hypothetical protein n=1 Tax=Atopobium sp. oral taxon 810 TaxID=712158 RepID=UPI000396B8A1|nr:hypothetical protein [Atopobium sp. oral taxon 810]ERI06371.1 hypothetical protein HMPREF9069_00320 [Atopobium sp. oral taxon 810 str. F0209]